MSKLSVVLKDELKVKEPSVLVGVCFSQRHKGKVDKENNSMCSFNSSVNRGERDEKICVFPNSKQHPLWQCSKYTNLSYKREFSKRNGL